MDSLLGFIKVDRCCFFDMYPFSCFPSDPYEVPEPEPGNGYLINIIAGVVVVAVLSIVLVVVITHVATKRSTKKKLLKPSTQPSDASPDSCEVH